MSYIYENDVSRVGGNLQKTVAYLLSLHKNEYEWNMLGIKVIGRIGKLPIPDGDYEYGDTYMVGTETPYEMYVYTRADEFHESDYWFDIGKFPQPGPQGPAGRGIGDVTDLSIKGVNSVSYNSTDGATIEYNEGTITSVDPNTHETVVDDIDTVTVELPIRAGQYLSMDADSTDGMIEVKVDDTELSKDYVKAKKSGSDSVPFFNGTQNTVSWQTTTDNAANYSIVIRDNTASAKFSSVYLSAIRDLSNNTIVATAEALYRSVRPAADLTFSKTSTNTGTVDQAYLTMLQNYPQMHVVYDGQLYYRMDPLAAPDGTLSYIHIDSIQSGGKYVMTGKCFSITVSTRGWQVVDLDFSGTAVEEYINTVTMSSSGNCQIVFTLTTPFVINNTNIWSLLGGYTIAIMFQNLATSSTSFEGAILVMPDAASNEVTVTTGSNSYRYTTNQLRVSVDTTKMR